MLLAIDVGNTSIKFGVFEADKLRTTWQMATSIRRMADEYAALLLNLLNYENLTVADITDVVLCSVVPPFNTIMFTLAEQYFHISPLLIEAGVKTGVRIRMDNPREVGADRIVNSAAAHHLYGGPVIIVDLGTATTFDVVSKEGDYVGGVIAPGINTAAEALFLRAAKLPRVELVRPRQAIGANTVAAMQSGLVFGYVGLVEGIVNRIQNELPEKAKIVATGGDAKIIARESSIVDFVETDLTLLGLGTIYHMNQSIVHKGGRLDH